MKARKEEKYFVEIKGQEFEFTREEADDLLEVLKTALGKSGKFELTLGKPIVAEPEPIRPLRPYAPPWTPWPYDYDGRPYVID